MKKIMGHISRGLLLSILAVCAFGQTNLQYQIAGGLGMGQPIIRTTVGWGSFGISPDGTNWAYTTVTLTARTTSLEEYYGRVLLKTNSYSLGALVGAGVATGTLGTTAQNVSGSFAGGGFAAADISKYTRIPNTSLVFAYKLQKANLVDPGNPGGGFTSNGYIGIAWNPK